VKIQQELAVLRENHFFHDAESFHFTPNST